MKRLKRLYILLGVLAVVCAATLLVLHHEERIDAVIVCGVEGCNMERMLQYGSAQSKFYSLSGTLDEEELFDQVQLILDARFAEGNRINL